MNRKTLSLKLFPVLAFFSLILFAQFALAQVPPCTPGPEVNGIRKYDCTFTNPITQAKGLGELIQSIVDQLQPFAIAIIVLVLIYIGFRIVAASASANPGELNRWKKFLLIALIAAAIIGGSSRIIGAIRQFAEGIK